MFKQFIIALLVAAPTSGCIRKSVQQTSLLRGEIAKDIPSTCSVLLPAAEHKELSSQLQPADPLYVITSNDLHGHADSREFTLQLPEQEPRTINAGGLERLASYLTALCRAAKTRLIYLDTGDSYQGTALSNMSNGIAIIESFSKLGLMASTFGNHEFDFGQDQIKTWLNLPQRSFWYVTSSLSTTVENKKIPWADLSTPRFARSVIFDVAGVKVGVAAYTTESTSVKSIPDNVKDVEFLSLKKVLTEEAEPLRKQGAEVTILLSHAGGSCDMKLPPAQGAIACKNNEHDELGRTLRENTDAGKQWTLIVAGHSHSPQRHILGETSVVQTSGLGLSLGHAQISLSNKIASVSLFDPIYLCENHFELWNGCHPQEWQWKSDSIRSLGRPKPPVVQGQPVKFAEGDAIKKILQPWREKLKSKMAQTITSLPVALSHDRTQTSPAAACLVDAWLHGIRNLRESWGEYRSSDVDGAFLNAGALRSGLPAGALTFGQLFEIIPYDNTTHITAMTDSELNTFAKVHEVSPHDYLLVSDGWSVLRRANDQPSPRTIDVKNKTPQRNTLGKWTIAVSTFSKTFLERAGIRAVPVDSGISVREIIADTLSKKRDKITSCGQAVTDRMQIQPGNGR